MTPLAPHIEAFFREHLVRHRGVSPHTCDSYAYSFQSLGTPALISEDDAKAICKEIETALPLLARK